MPALLDTGSRVDVLTAAINHVLITDGPAGLTLRRIAKVSGVSPASMLQHLGSREHLIRVAAARTARNRRDDIESRACSEGALAFLPATSEHVLSARAWLGWLEIWRCEETLERWITQGRAEERALMARLLDYQLVTDDLDAAVALVDGLTVAVCAPCRPMRVDRARQMLTRQLRLLGCEVRPYEGDLTRPAALGHVTHRERAVSSW